MKHKYRIVPVLSDDEYLIGIHWDNQLYIDATLPFGLHSAPLIFTAVVDACATMGHSAAKGSTLGTLPWWYHYHWSTKLKPMCLKPTKLIILKELGVPLATHKLVGPTTCLTFLGIEIDTLAMELRLPQKKLNSGLKDLLSKWQFKKVCSREKLESLLGHLNHACSQECTMESVHVHSTSADICFWIWRHICSCQKAWISLASS